VPDGTRDFFAAGVGGGLGWRRRQTRGRKEQLREGDAVEFLERVGRNSGKPQVSFVRLLTEAEAAAVPRLKPRPRRTG
jgi:hypothetical protein